MGLLPEFPGLGGLKRQELKMLVSVSLNNEPDGPLTQVAYSVEQNEGLSHPPWIF